MSAQQAGRELRLRELRAVVAASRTVSLDEEGRALAKTLQESLDSRVNALRDEWVARITNALDEHRVADAAARRRPPARAATRCRPSWRCVWPSRRSRHVRRDPARTVALAPRGRGRITGAPDGPPSGIPSDPAVQAARSQLRRLVPSWPSSSVADPASPAEAHDDPASAPQRSERAGPLSAP